MRNNENKLLTENRIARFSFSIIRFMHNNFLLRIARNPFRILGSLGVQKGQNVLEIGCGPGFFTFPAAHLVGLSGRIYALDVNPYAVRYIKNLIRKKKTVNVEVLHANASDTDLPEHQIDLAFFIGVPHVAGGIQPVLQELERVLKPNGKISFHLGRWPEATLVEEMAACGFKLVEENGRIRIFQKEKRSHERHD